MWSMWKHFTICLLFVFYLFTLCLLFVYSLFTIYFQFYHKKQCDQCGKVPKDPAVCLMCGTMVCMRETCCRKPIVVNQGNKEGKKPSWHKLGTILENIKCLNIGSYQKNVSSNSCSTKLVFLNENQTFRQIQMIFWS